MRTREQRRAARSARGWPRLRVHAVRNGVGAVILGALLLWVTHGPFRFENFPAGDVAWVWRVIALVVAVMLPYVLLTMGVYLLLAGFLATNRAALAAGRARTVVLEPEDPEDPPVTTHRLSEHTPPGVKIRAHTVHGRRHDSRYTRDLLGLLPVQSPAALAPLGAGIVALIAASIYYSTGYAEPAAVLLLGVLYLGWKLFRGWRSHRVFADTPWQAPREVDTGSVPRVTPLRDPDTAHHPVTRVVDLVRRPGGAVRDHRRAARDREDPRPVYRAPPDECVAATVGGAGGARGDPAEAPARGRGRTGGHARHRPPGGT